MGVVCGVADSMVVNALTNRMQSSIGNRVICKDFPMQMWEVIMPLTLGKRT